MCYNSYVNYISRSIMKKEQIIKRAEQLRSSGFSFREISEDLNISKSTASLWLGHIKLSRKAEERINNLGANGRAKGIETNKKRVAEENIAIIKKVDDYLSRTKVDLKVACSLLYWGEGTKYKANNLVSFTNADPEMISYFLYAFRNSFNLDEKKFRALIHLHEYHDAEKQLKFWSSITKIPKNQFYKSYFKKNTGKNRKNNYPGCINIRYPDHKIYKELIIIIRKLTNIQMRG